MADRTSNQAPPDSSRREFLKTSTGAAVGASLLGSLSVPRAVHAASSDTIKIGLVGCGGRGSGAALNAMRADENCQLVAMADVFADRLAVSRASLAKAGGEKFYVREEQCFVGFDAYQKLLECDLDVVVLATPPHFRPEHIRAAVERGVHIFAEKPVAVDAPGVRSVMASCETAAEKGLSVVSGLCFRYFNPAREAVRRIHDGAIGEIHTLQANDYRGELWSKPRQEGWTDMQWQMRNWLYFTWLSGDFNVEQHIHMLDACSWIMGDRYPVKAIGTGGRQKRTDPEFGNIFDHHSVVYEYDDGAKLFANARQMDGCERNMSTEARGTAGSVFLSKTKHTMTTSQGPWRYRGEENNRFQTEHDELFASIRRGEPINNGQYMANSTLLAILGRMATYTGQEITWEQALNSQERLGPESYQWDEAPEPVVAVPGVTKFV